MEDRHNPSAATSRRPWKRRKPTPDYTKPLQFVTASSSAPIQNPATDVRGNYSSPAQKMMTNMGYSPGTVPGIVNPKNVGMDFYNYSGFAVKMMSKMGYKAGSGLGKDEQGIVAPIRAMWRRSKNLGLGFEVENTVIQKAKKKVVRRCRGGWLQGNNKRKRTLGFMTECEIRVMNEEIEIGGGNQMGGGSGSMTIVPRAPVRWDADNASPVLEVLHSVPLAVDSEEDVSMPSDHSTEEVPMAHTDDSENLPVEGSENVSDSIKDVPDDLDEDPVEDDLLRMHRELRGKLVNGFRCRAGVKGIINGELERVAEDLSLGALTLDSLLKTFRYLKDQFAEEYKLCKLSIIAFSYAYPLLVEVYEGWKPLQNPMHGIEFISALRDLLQGEQHRDQNVAGYSPYELLVSEVVLPAVTNSWQEWEPKPMLQFLKSWGRLLPAPVLESVLENVVMPKLLVAVKSWYAMRETVPIYTWIHPWLPLLGERLGVLYDKISF